MGEHEFVKAELNDRYGKDNATVKALESYTETDSMTVKRDTLALRVWIYKVAMAGLLILFGFTTWQAVTLEQWTRLIESLLSLSGVAVADMARRNAR